MAAPQVFLSHTDRSEQDRKATTAILVELRRVGLRVWIDREHPAPAATEEQQAAGPTPQNPLFQHITSALSTCDAVLYVCSKTSLNREFVRLEFDPRIIYQEFQRSHPDVPPDELPVYLALTEPLQEPPELWPFLVDMICPGRVLNLTRAGSTPLILPTVLTTMIREIAPEHLLPMNPVSEWVVKHLMMKSVDDIPPGCPADLSPEVWLQLEDSLGLGPLFPGDFQSIDDQQLRYGAYRIGDTVRFLHGFRRSTTVPPQVSTLLTLWTANLMLRSPATRVQQGQDLAVEFSLPSALGAAEKHNDRPLLLAASLQYGLGLLSSPITPRLDEAAGILAAMNEAFQVLGAHSLAALAEVLRARAASDSPSREAVVHLEDLGLDPETADPLELHHAALAAIFPGPRIEATQEYRARLQEFQNLGFRAASELEAGFARRGEEQFNPAFWQDDNGPQST